MISNYPYPFVGRELGHPNRVALAYLGGN